jgi:phage baseplate assembly protein W
MATYKGFSTVSNLSQKKFVLTDNDLIKQDLLNVLKVRRGSRVMQPNIGCLAYERLFEIISPYDVQDISDNIKSIVSNDPRISLVSLDITPLENNITCTLVLKYTQTNQLDQMIITFNENMDAF